MSIRISQNSFSRGIISPSLQSRVDLEQHSLGLADLENGFIAQEGCILNRSGLEYLLTTKFSDKKCRIIPFVFNLNQSYIIELGNKYLRILKDGAYITLDDGSILELETNYLENELFEIDYVQQADVLTIVHKNHKPCELSRLEHNVWEINEIDFRSNISSPTNVKAIYTGSTSSNTTTYQYVVCAVDNESNEESARSEVASVLGHLEAYWTTSEFITINWNEVQNAKEYNVYRSVNGMFGYVGTSTTTTFVDNNIEPDLTSCAPIVNNPFENENPSCVCFYQQRKIYASSLKHPQTFWASQTGTNNNFNLSRPLNSTDSISMTIYDNVANSIQHLIPFNDLLAITTNAEWAIRGKDGVFSANPSPITALQSYYGASKVKPVISGSMVLFVQSGGSTVRDLGFNYLTNSYDGQELSLFANNIFLGKQIIDIAYSKEPYRILWCVMNDGSINALTYNQKQKITAWHKHTTLGLFESVATIRENNEDVAYFVVKRCINGKEYRFIERFRSRILNSLDNAFFLDCALSAKFEQPVNTISNLSHLRNTRVNALLDGGVVENLLVDDNGLVELPYEAKNVVIGLPYQFKIQTLNFDNEQSLGVKKVINKIEVKILNSREDFSILNDDLSLNQNARSLESINNPYKLFTKDVEFCPLSNVSLNANVIIVQDKPLPLNILSLNATISLQEVEAQ